MKPSLIHLEHALPPLAELGLEHLVPVLLRGGKVTLDTDTIARILKGLAVGADKRAARSLVAISLATGEELLGWELEPKLEAEALKNAALKTFDEAKESILGFFSSLGLSLNVTPDSSAPGEENPETVETNALAATES